MSNVYSAKLFSAPSTSGGPSIAYIVPMSRVVVVRTITIVWGDIVGSGLDAWVQTADLCKLVRYTWAFTPSTPTNLGGTVTYDLHHVLTFPDHLAVQTAAGTCDIYCSGYELVP